MLTFYIQILQANNPVKKNIGYMAANPQILHGKSSLFGTSGVLNGIVYWRCKINVTLAKGILL